ncbi:MAG TPA: PLAT/LH2 domain-containing protein, partial [Nitrospiria bacterium]|nr:PLAT/LH2 domain-containing protein [Nitrospiria bacterium]
WLVSDGKNEEVRPEADGAGTEAVRVAPSNQDEFNMIRVAVVPVACCRVDDLRFEFGSSFVGPDIAVEMGQLSRLILNNPGCPLSIFGHADPVGNDDDNKKLSGRRATAIYALLTRDADLWEVLNSKPHGNDKWGKHAIDVMLQTVSPGAAEPDATPYEQDKGKRKQLFESYMDKLCGPDLKLEKKDFLAQGADADGKGDYQGCSEFNPVFLFSQEDFAKYEKAQDKTERNKENSPNRRVMVLLFRKGSRIDPSKWPCPRAKEGTGDCKKRFWSDGETRRSARLKDKPREYKETKDTFACRFYDRLISRPHPQPPPPSVRDPVISGDTIVQVNGAIPDALVEVFVTRNPGGSIFTGHAIADPTSPSTTIRSSFAFQPGDVVTARQTLCEQVSPFGSSVTVKVPPPLYSPRPFYVVGHNPNTIQEVIAALDAGANAVEPDVNVYSHNPRQLCISHGEGDNNAPTLTQFLNDLHAIALQRPQLSLVVFDCKPKVATPQHGETLLQEIRNRLTFDIQLNVIISVSQLSEAAIFTNIKTGLQPREGLMVDEENDPVAVSNFFTSVGVTHQGFGNGISVLNNILGPNVRPSMERACHFRASTNRIRFIYVWTVEQEDLLEEYIRIGVDGIITDHIPRLRQVVGEGEFRSLVRLADRAYNPFAPSNFAYGVHVYTGNVGHAGTDANVTFTLTGANGSASVRVNTKLPYRMERGQENFVTLQSPDLGELRFITVQRDNQGNAPDWFLDHIQVESFRYRVSKRAVFNRWIDSTSPFTQPLA